MAPIASTSAIGGNTGGREARGALRVLSGFQKKATALTYTVLLLPQSPYTRTFAVLDSTLKA